MAQSTPTKIKLLLADVDGTLVTDQKILTERAQESVHKLRARGIHFALTSGRPPRGMAMLVEPLKLDTALAGFNGGLYVKPDLSIIEARTLPGDVTRKTIELIKAHNMDAWLYSGNDWFVHDKEAPHVAREEWTVKFPPTVVAEFPADALEKASKIVGVSDDHDLVARCEADVQKAVGTTASAARSQPYYLDVTHPDANKGGVVLYLAKMMGISPQEIATIGDMPNDVLMFKQSGLSIAMGNSSDEVKKQATEVTDSFKDEGFAKAVERFILGEPG